MSLRARLARAVDAQRLRVSRAEALPQLAVLGVVCGVATALVMVAFRLLIEHAQAAFLPPGSIENYEGLDAATRLALPLAGGVLLALLFLPLPDLRRHVGVVHVMERLAYHQGRLPLANGVLQFVAAAIAIVAGMSVGREGPAIHMGAASGSVLGQRLRLPNNGIRVLVGCGVAAAIAASFNTPLAGVVFTMEVVLMEYTVVGFAPVILAAVSATAVTQLVYGATPAFVVPAMTLASLWELPWILVIGLVIGGLAAAFIAIVERTARATRRVPLVVRFVGAGAVCGLLAVPAPQIMGIGYDTVTSALVGELSLAVLGSVVVFKLLASGLAIGAGVPGGLIGPLVFVGAAAGGALGLIGQAAAGAVASVSSAGFYALVGIGAMMAGALHAPLAALTAMLELTGNPHVLWPGMLAAIAAYGVSRVLFRQDPVFVTLLRARGLDYRNDPVAQSLRRVGVAAAMDREFAVLPRTAERAAVERALAGRVRWVVVTGSGDRPAMLLAATDLARAVVDAPDASVFDLVELPAARLGIASIGVEATLQQALEALAEAGAEALCVTGAGAGAVLGVLTRHEIDAARA